MKTATIGISNVKGLNNLARVRGVVAIAIIEAIDKQRLARGDKRDHIVAMERSEHKFGDLVDIRYHPPNKDVPGWR